MTPAIHRDPARDPLFAFWSLETASGTAGSLSPYPSAETQLALMHRL